MLQFLRALILILLKTKSMQSLAKMALGKARWSKLFLG
jgi:hypothetical protein